MPPDGEKAIREPCFFAIAGHILITAYSIFRMGDLNDSVDWGRAEGATGTRAQRHDSEC